MQPRGRLGHPPRHRTHQGGGRGRTAGCRRNRPACANWLSSSLHAVEGTRAGRIGRMV